MKRVREAHDDRGTYPGQFAIFIQERNGDGGDGSIVVADDTRAGDEMEYVRRKLQRESHKLKRRRRFGGIQFEMDAAQHFKDHLLNTMKGKVYRNSELDGSG